CDVEELHAVLRRDLFVLLAAGDGVQGVIQTRSSSPRKRGPSIPEYLLQHHSVSAPSGFTGSPLSRERQDGGEWSLQLRIGRWQLKRRIDQRGGTLEIVVAVDVLLHHERSAAIEFLVLLMPATELGADEVPGKSHQRDPGFRVGRG